MSNFKIIATGAYLPEKVLTNNDLAKLIETTDEWIYSRSGIKQRHIANEKEDTSTLATKALEDALISGSIDPATLDAVIVATATADTPFPSVACIAAGKLGITKAFAFDLQAACSGFLFALHTASALIGAGANRIAIVGADKMSKIVDWQDRSTCVLFGDGAGAVIIEKSPTKALLGFSLGSDGNFADILNTPNNIIKMNGREVFRLAVEKMVSSSKDAMHMANLTINDIDLIVPHQANIRILNMVAEQLGAPQEKIVATIENHANTSAATIPLALNFIAKKESISNKKILFAAAGAGFTWGSLVIAN